MVVEGILDKVSVQGDENVFSLLVVTLVGVTNGIEIIIQDINGYFFTDDGDEVFFKWVAPPMFNRNGVWSANKIHGLHVL